MLCLLRRKIVPYPFMLIVRCGQEPHLCRPEHNIAWNTPLALPLERIVFQWLVYEGRYSPNGIIGLILSSRKKLADRIA